MTKEAPRAGRPAADCDDHPSAAVGPDGMALWSSEKGPVVGGHPHTRCIWYLTEVLEHRYRDHPGGSYVGPDLKLYLDERDPSRWLGPDVLLALGVPREPPRMSYLPWIEGKMPDVCFEIASKKTRKKDLVRNRRLYAELGIPEYFVFDLERETVVGFRLPPSAATVYEPIAPDASGRVASRVLGLRVGRRAGEPKLVGLFDDAGHLVALRERLEISEAARRVAEAARREAEAARDESEAARRALEVRLRELEGGGSSGA